MSTPKHLNWKDLNKVLPIATAAEFEVVAIEKRTSTRIVAAGFGQVNFEELSIERASQLVQQKFPYLKKKAPKTSE